MMKEAVEDLTTTLNEAASAAGVVGGMVDSITQAINQVSGLWTWSELKMAEEVLQGPYKIFWLELEPESCDCLLQLDEGPMGEPEGTFVDYQTTMVKTAKAIAVTVQEMVGASNPVAAESIACHPGRATTLLTGPTQCRAPPTPTLLLLAGHQIHHQPRRAGHTGQPAHQ